MNRTLLCAVALAAGACLVLHCAPRAGATELSKEELLALFNGSATTVDVDKDGDKPVIGFTIFPKGGNADGALAKLQVCKKVRKADIAGKAGMTDKGLECLKDMVEMEDLKIGAGKYTEKGLANLKGMTKLKKLELAAPDTGEGLAFLKECKDLKVLKLSGTKITDESFANLKDLTNLEELELKYTSLDDKGMAHLAGLTNLKKLNLVSTKITSASLPTLKGFTNLEELYLSKPSTKVIGKKAVTGKDGFDDKAADELKKALTKLKMFDRF
jgi:Leucine-rich repeat (LRR) protein